MTGAPTGTVAVEVLLATHNGQRYLADLLDSVLGQSHRPNRITVADDGSTDDTIDVLDHYRSDHPDMISVVGTARVGSALRNFGRLIELADADLVLFADQDDIWAVDKIARAVDTMTTAAPDVPLCYFTDMTVAERSGRRIADSYMAYAGLDPTSTAFSQLAVQNCVSGNTMAVNRALLDAARPLPELAINHDWWIAMVAAAHGRFIYDPAPSLAYRQHDSNAEGAKRWGCGRLLREAVRIGRTGRHRLDAKARQLEAFAERYPETEAGRQARLFTEARDGPIGHRQRVLARSGIRHDHLVKDVALWALI